MGALGRVDAIWRYPVKSMQGEHVDSVFVGFGGVMGDRVYGMINGKGEKGTGGVYLVWSSPPW